MSLRAVARLACAAVPLGAAASLHAQDAYVYYDHRPDPATLDQRLSYLLPGERGRRSPAEAERHPGRPPVLQVRRGSSACFAVDDANPLLYSYSIGSKAVTVEQAAGLSDLVAQLALSAAGAVTPAKATQTAGAPFAPPPPPSRATAVTTSAEVLATAKTTADTIGKLRAALDAANRRSAELQSTAGELEAENRRLTRRIASLQAKIDSLETELATLVALQEYAGAVKEVVDLTSALEALKFDSDADVDLARSIKRADALADSSAAKDKSATARYAQHKGETAFELLHGLQTNARAQAVQLDGEFTAAGSTVISQPAFCVTPKDGRMQGILIATAKYKLKDGQERKRPVDTVATFLVDPVDDQVFEVVPAGFIAFGVADAKEFGISNGLVTSRPDRRPVVTPGMFALARVREAPLWGAIGVSKGREKVDVFFGLAVRGGASIVGSNLILGAGLTLANVATDLSKGEVGKPLPADVKSLDDVINRSYRPGAAVVFSISGLAIGGKKDDSGTAK